MLCRRRKTALVPLSLAALVKVVAASECTSRISVEQSCWDNFAPCYLLWGVAVVYAIWSSKRVEREVREAKNAGEVGAAHARWKKAKKWPFLISAICMLFHFVSFLWMGLPWLWEAIAVCILLGVAFSVHLVKHGDGMFNNNIVLVSHCVGEGQANPLRLTLANAVAVRNGQQAPLTLASHPGYAICRDFPERRGEYESYPEWYPNLQLES